MKIEKELFKKIEKHVENKFIRVQKHPTEELYIYNYTNKTQFEGKWDEATMMCRGLILDDKKNIVARPFEKFFNIEELKEIPKGEFIAEEKMDGSLGILYWVDNLPYIATRGSFTSDQAIVANAYLRDEDLGRRDFNRTKTYLFEIIYPENRIVVDYAGFQGLVYLGGRDISSGEAHWDDSMKGIFKIPYRVYGFSVESFSEVKKKYAKENEEGFVILWENGERAKIKFEEYVRLHRIITGVSERRIWELLKNHDPIDSLLDAVPDEFYSFVKMTVAELLQKFHVVKKTCEYYKIRAEQLDGENGREYRKNQAKYLRKNCPDRLTIVFAMIDQKPYEDKLWRLLKPESTEAFYNKKHRENYA